MDASIETTILDISEPYGLSTLIGLENSFSENNNALDPIIMGEDSEGEGPEEDWTLRDDADDGERDDSGEIGFNHMQELPVLVSNQILNDPKAYEWIWMEGCVGVEELPFTGQPGPQVDISPEASPWEFVQLFITPRMIEILTVETNRYAASFFETAQLKPRSRFHKWKAASEGDMISFLGLVTAMGLVKQEDLHDYWTQDPLLRTPFFPSAMPRDRFLCLLSFLHLNDNRNFVPRGQQGYDALYKIRPVITILQDQFAANYSPYQHLALDEAMVAWRGPLHFRVYNPEKPDKFGVKMYEVCDSRNGYCLRLEIYSGKESSPPSAKGSIYDLVMRLMSPFLDKGHKLFVDNYYTSPVLFSDLQSRSTGACGTLRLNRCGVCPHMKQKKLVKKKGEYVLRTNGSINHIKLMDRKEVNVLSTIHDSTIQPTGKTDRETGQPQTKFTAIQDYNKFMGAVDRSDQMVQYSAFRRRTLKWYKKVFFHLIMLAELNAYLLYKEVRKSAGLRFMASSGGRHQNRW